MVQTGKMFPGKYVKGKVAVNNVNTNQTLDQTPTQVQTVRKDMQPCNVVESNGGRDK